MGYAVVIGAVNLDIGGSVSRPLVCRDSNPGKVSSSPGGVGHNIARNLCLLDVPTKLLTVLGDDSFAQKILEHAAEAGLDFSAAETIVGEETSTYLFVSGPDGEMEIAVSDMAIADQITPAFLEQRMALINGASICVVDTNFPAESLLFLTQHCTVPIFADPVSTVKAQKLRPILGKLHTIKPNRLEAEVLSGVKIHSEADLPLAASVLLAEGLQQVFISLGEDGVYAMDSSGREAVVPNPPRHVRNATGSGDAMTAALAAAYLRGYDLLQAAEIGVAAGAMTAESPETIHPDLSWTTLCARSV
ncbi:MAG: carbohydrate kinase family protein [Oscillospiraceae bacterium]